MFRIFYKRLISSIPMLLGVTLISFFIMKAAPGDPASIYMDPNVSLQDMEQIRKNLGFDKPLIQQYFLWLKELFSGNLGYSFVTGKPVVQAILERLPATLLLSIVSLIVILCITFPLGIYCGYKKIHL